MRVILVLPANKMDRSYTRNWLSKFPTLTYLEKNPILINLISNVWINLFFLITFVYLGIGLNSRQDIPKPNCCSRRIPIKTKLNMFASRWITPACNQIQLTSLHPWCPCTTLYHSRPPNFSNLQSWSRIKVKILP